MSNERQLLDVVIHEGRGVISPNEELAIRLWIRSAVSAIAKVDEYEAKAKAFDAVIRSYDYAPSYSQIGEDVMIIVNKYRE